MNKFLLFFILYIQFVCKGNVSANDGDTLHIITHDQTKVVTDPSKGFNAYKSWRLFPPEEIKYRKAVLYVTYQCPDSQRCGEWDYIDNIFLRRKGGENDSSLNIELARMISPYGSRFTPDWKFTWFVDVTDFSFLLHDSIEIEFNHTGYESNNDRGWLITLDFKLTEGIPANEIIGYKKLWEGSFPYGNDSNDIENYLKPINFKNDFDADFVRLRVLQTGHGMDELENCAEFCNKYRTIFFDNELIEQKQIWRECGDNPLYPQAGTWIFDRANWCPGSMVHPDVYDFKIGKDTEHTLNIDMEPYVNRSKPSANYVISSYLFYCKDPFAKDDVSIEEIISPSMEDINLRRNPVCFEPKILIKNNGTNILTNLKIAYGAEGEEMQTFDWEGNLSSLKSSEIVLPGIISNNTESDNFKVTLTFPNQTEDEYYYDNSLTSVLKMPPVFDSKFILVLKTNNDSSNNYWQLKNGREIIFRKRDIGTLKANTVYRDTINLRPGCYELAIGDTANDGLDFWFNPEGGYGYARILDLNGKLIKSFNSDFGREIRQQFIVTGQSSPDKENVEPILNIFPIRNPGKFYVDIFLNEKQNITLQITTEDKKKTVYKKKLKKFKEGTIDIDISNKKNGFYFVNLITDKKLVSKKMKLKKD